MSWIKATFQTLIWQTWRHFKLKRSVKSATETAQKWYGQKNPSYDLTDDLTVSPIVSRPNCPKRPSSQLINIILKYFLIPGKSYVKDNLDFLRNALEKTGFITFLIFKRICTGKYTDKIRKW